jgi:hypothetical protein
MIFEFFNKMNPVSLVIMIGLLNLVVLIGIALIFGTWNISIGSIAIQTANNTNQIKEISNDTNNVIASNNRTNTIIAFMNRSAIEAEESRQNQTETLLPVLYRSFNQTDTIAELAQDLNNTEARLDVLLNERTPIIKNISTQTGRLVDATHELKDTLPGLISLVRNISESNSYLANNFGQGSGYLARENQQYIQANNTFSHLNQTLEKIEGLLSGSGNINVSSAP